MLKKTVTLLTVFALIFAIAIPAFAEEKDYDLYKADELVPFEKTYTQWELGWGIYSIIDKTFNPKRDKVVEENGFKIVTYTMIPGLGFTLYCDPETNQILKAFTNFTWEGITNDEATLAASKTADAYQCMASACIGVGESDADLLAKGWDKIDITSLTLNRYRQYIDGGYVFYGWFSKNFCLDAGFFVEKK